METIGFMDGLNLDVLVSVSYFLLIASAFLGVLLHSKIFWNYRAFAVSFDIIIIGTALGLLVVSQENAGIITLILIMQFYRIFGLLRIIKHRLDNGALRNRSLRTELFFNILSLLIIIVAQTDIYEVLLPIEWLLVLASAQIVVALIYWNHIKESAKSTNLPPKQRSLTDSEVPSLTVAIPARNETEELSQTLSELLDSNYPKLEIIVLDDCSQDRTSEIIKNFAHRGVRFISGKSPSGSWLAKNYAYHQLLDEANGKYVLFCGTDVRFGKTAIRDLIENIILKEIDMASVLPVRFSPPMDRHFLLQPMRYWREMVIPKLLDKSPPVLSTCWIINRKILLKNGGFAAYKKAIRPEKFFARNVNKTGRYKFIRASSGYQISSVKDLPAQWNTAVRTRYPELRNQPEKVFLSTMFIILLIFGAPVVLATGLISGQFLITVFSFLSTIIFIIIYLSVSRLTNPKTSMLKIFMMPISIVLEIIINNYSMWAYEFSTVYWKGRNICIPVLQNIPHLPK